ncbi:MAG: mannosyltransferase family protein, partial [Chloroflexota bacterium]
MTKRLSRRDIILLIVAFLLTRAAITAAGVLSMRVLPSSEGEEYTHLLDGGAALDMWYRWDAGFYATIATYNYDWINDQRPSDDMAFLPVYPLAIHLVSGMTPTGCALSPYLSTCATLGGLAVSNVALLLSVFLLFDLAQRHFGRPAAWRTVLLLLVSPISIFLSGVYTESLFLLLTLLTFWLLEGDHFLLAVLVASVACLTRSVGVALFLPLLWVAWRGRSMLRLYRIVLAFVPPLLFAGYILLAGVSVGDPLAFFKTFDTTWGRVAGTPIQAFTVYFSGEEVSLFGWRLSWLDLLLTLVYLALSALLLREKTTRLWGVFALVAILVPVASGSLLSMPRYGAAIFPFTILLGKWADRVPKQVLIYGAAAALALLFLTRFVTWRWIA